MSIKVDAMDEHLLLALREGPQGLQSLTALAGINYNTLRQRVDKLIRYGYLAKPGYGKYSLTDKGRCFVDELSSPVAPDFDDPCLKKLIDMLPSELHRAFFRLVIAGIIAKHLCLKSMRTATLVLSLEDERRVLRQLWARSYAEFLD